MCLTELLGGKKATPTTPTVDPEAERRKAQQEADAKTNEQLVADSRRKRQQAGVVATGGDYGGSVLASAAKDAVSTVLSGGQ